MNRMVGFKKLIVCLVLNITFVTYTISSNSSLQNITDYDDLYSGVDDFYTNDQDFYNADDDFYTNDQDFYNADDDFYSDDDDFFNDDYDFDSDDYGLNDYDNDYNYDTLTNKEPNYFDIDGQDCASFYTCYSSLAQRNCYCDALCEAYQDCCFDTMFSSLTHSATSRESKLLEFTSCKLLPDVFDEWYMYVIDSCPLNSNYSLNNQCTSVNENDIYSTTPATGKESGMIYRNMFCAMCHEEDFYLWIPKIDCRWNSPYSGNYTIEALLKLKECRKSFEGGAEKIRKCQPLASTCSAENVTGNIDTNNTYSIAHLCESSDNKFVFTPDKVYKNKHCYECDEHRAPNVSCFHFFHNLSLSVIIRGDGMYSYKMLFSLQDRKVTRIKHSIFSFSSPETEEVELQSICGSDQVFDPFEESCRTVFCAGDKIFKDGKCIERSSQAPKNLQSDNCKSVKFEEDEYVKHNESSITILLSNKTFHNVKIDNKTAFVCVSIRTVYGKRRTVSDFEGTLSLICSTISIVFLILTIFIYSFRKMRNTSGKILLSLSISLCISKLLFVFASSAENFPTLCSLVAICIHYFYLASFTWMNVISFDAHGTFTTLVFNSKDNTKRFILYSLYAFNLPLVIVGCGFMIDKMTSSSWRPAYGSNICWISNPNGLFAFFLIPVAVLVFSNILLYFRTSWFIFRAKRSSAKKFNKRDKCEILIYVKLSIVMGLTWLFAYIAIIFNEDFLWYLSIILNGLQGVLIFCCFVLNKKVFGIVCEKINRKMVNDRSNTCSSKSSS